jgi:hypothetical protein
MYNVMSPTGTTRSGSSKQRPISRPRAGSTMLSPTRVSPATTRSLPLTVCLTAKQDSRNRPLHRNLTRFIIRERAEEARPEHHRNQSPRHVVHNQTGTSLLHFSKRHTTKPRAGRHMPRLGRIRRCLSRRAPDSAVLQHQVGQQGHHARPATDRFLPRLEGQCHLPVVSSIHSPIISIF